MARASKTKYLEEQKRRHQEYLDKKHKAYVLSQIKEYNVPKQIELLEFLFSILPTLSRNNVKSILSKRCVAVNGCACTQFNYTLYRGDIVMISKIPFDKQLVNKRENSNKKEDPKKITKLDVIYEDNDFIVINKPSGLLSIESDKEKVETAYKLVLEYIQMKNKQARAFQVHRIDKNTSGVLLFAKDFNLKEELRKEWNKIVSLREYIAIVEGKMYKTEDTVRSYLKETDTNLMYTSHKIGDGQLAVTNYKVMKETSKYSLLNVVIESGRKNQIRVAMNDLGHPIIGDDKYGKPSNPINRLGLHASALEITHPKTGKKYKFKAPIPKEFLKMFDLK